MGGSTSKVTKTIEADGQVNNNVVIQDTVSVKSDEMLILLTIIALVNGAQLIYTIYTQYKKALKKKYTNRSRLELQ